MLEKVIWESPVRRNPGLWDGIGPSSAITCCFSGGLAYSNWEIPTHVKSNLLLLKYLLKDSACYLIGIFMIQIAMAVYRQVAA